MAGAQGRGHALGEQPAGQHVLLGRGFRGGLVLAGDGAHGWQGPLQPPIQPERSPLEHLGDPARVGRERRTRRHAGSEQTTGNGTRSPTRPGGNVVGTPLAREADHEPATSSGAAHPVLRHRRHRAHGGGARPRLPCTRRGYGGRRLPGRRPGPGRHRGPGRPGHPAPGAGGARPAPPLSPVPLAARVRRRRAPHPPPGTLPLRSRGCPSRRPAPRPHRALPRDLRCAAAAGGREADGRSRHGDRGLRGGRLLAGVQARPAVRRHPERRARPGRVHARGAGPRPRPAGRRRGRRRRGLRRAAGAGEGSRHPAAGPARRAALRPATSGRRRGRRRRAPASPGAGRRARPWRPRPLPRGPLRRRGPAPRARPLHPDEPAGRPSPGAPRGARARSSRDRDRRGGDPPGALRGRRHHGTAGRSGDPGVDAGSRAALDPAWRRTAGASARQLVGARYSMAAMADSYVHFYRSALHARRAA